MHHTSPDTSFLGVDVTFPERARWRHWRTPRRRFPLGLWLLLALAACVVISLASPRSHSGTGDSSPSTNASGTCTNGQTPVKRTLTTTCQLTHADIRADLTPDAVLPDINCKSQ